MEEKKIKYQVFVIGCGGTGTYLLKELSRYLASGVHKEDIEDLYIFDGDIVEDKNLARQAFAEEDIGQNKAVCMADVLNAAFGTHWRAVPEYLTEEGQLAQFLREDSGRTIYMPVFIGCVDNHGCRILMEELFGRLDTCGYLDSANEFYAGESVFAYKFAGAVASPCRSYYFPEIKTGDRRNRGEISCEELNNVAPQHITTNMLAGNVLFSEMCALFDKHPHPGLITFDSGEFIMEYTPFKEAS